MSVPREVFMQAVKVELEGMTGVRPWGGEYLNPPFVELLYTHPELQNRHPYVGVVEMEGSQITEDDRDGGEYDDFNFGLYGQMIKTPSVAAREWVSRLRHDSAVTLRKATRHALFKSHGIECPWIKLGPEVYGESTDGNAADFLLPATARLYYALVTE